MPYNPNGGVNNLTVPTSAEEMLRTYPALISTIQKLENKITELENKVKALEVIGGNVNQL